MSKKCYCYSGEPYATCCRPVHLGKIRPSPPHLMRARYAAYALGNVRFILQSERPNPPLLPKELTAKRRSLKEFCKKTQFLGLQILEEAMLDDRQATVTFRATLLQDGQDASFTEKSLFVLRNGRWFYVAAL
mgnify:CR=1 FL=1